MWIPRLFIDTLTKQLAEQTSAVARLRDTLYDEMNEHDKRLMASDARAVADAARIVELERQNAAHAATIDWMRVRVNQLEGERATLFQRVTQLPIAVPTIQRAPAETPLSRVALDELRSTEEDGAPSLDTPDALLAQLGGLFADMGDDAALSAGIVHRDDGTVQHPPSAT